MCSIEYLKSIVQDKMEIKFKDGTIHVLTRSDAPNAPLRLNGRFLSWDSLKEMIDAKDCHLIVKESQEGMFPGYDKERKENNLTEKKQHGGSRPGAGRKKKLPYDRKRPMSFALVYEDSDHLDFMCEDLGVSRSQLVSTLIKDKWSNMRGIPSSSDNASVSLSSSALSKLKYYLEGFGEDDRKPSITQIIDRLIQDNLS